MNKTELARFERVSHILIEEGFGDFFVKSGILDKLSFTDRVGLFFEKRLPLAHRIKVAANRCGPSFVNFVKYISTRTDVLDPKLCYELSNIEADEPQKNTQITIPEIKIQKKNYAHLKNKPLFFDGFSYRCTMQPKAKKDSNAKLYELHFLEKKIMTMYERDLNILHFFASIIDSQCTYSFNAKRVVREYMILIHQRFHLKKHISYAQKLKGALTSHNISLPNYVKNESTDHKLVLKPVNGIAADEIPKAILAFHEHNAEMMKNITTLLFSPIFTHGFLLKEIDLDNIILQKKGAVGLNHIPEIEHLTKIEVATVTTLFSGLLTKDTAEVLHSVNVTDESKQYKYLTKKIKTVFELHTHLQSKHIEQILELIHSKHKIPTHIFSIVQLMHICEEIQYHFQTRRTILILLEQHIKKSLHILAKNELAHTKKLTKAQKILFSEGEINKELSQINLKKMSIHSHLSVIGFLIVVMLTFSLIIELLSVQINSLEIGIIIFACYLLTLISKHHIMQHANFTKPRQ